MGLQDRCLQKECSWVGNPLCMPELRHAPVKPALSLHGQHIPQAGLHHWCQCGRGLPASRGVRAGRRRCACLAGGSLPTSWHSAPARQAPEWMSAEPRAEWMTSQSDVHWLPNKWLVPSSPHMSVMRTWTSWEKITLGGGNPTIIIRYQRITGLYSQKDERGVKIASIKLLLWIAWASITL